MNNRTPFGSNVHAARRALVPSLALTLLLLPHVAAAQEPHSAATEQEHSGAEAAQDRSGWAINFTPVLIAAKDGYDLGGGLDPEVRYTVDHGGALLSAGLRVGGYYAKNLYGIMTMPTLRITIPVGPVEPYAAFGMGYGWLLDDGREGIASMSRLGVVVRVSESLALGIEGTIQKIDDTPFRFPSLGSMVSFDL